MSSKRLLSFAAPSIGGLALVGVLVLPGTAAAASPPTWHVGVGAQSADAGKQANFFFTRKITIDAGETVQWTSDAGEIHTVTFLAGNPRPDLFVPSGGGITANPMAVAPAGGGTFDGSAYTNSGIMALGQTFSVTFTRPGDYDYVCLVHSQMAGTIHVQAAGARYPHTQAFYDVEAAVGRAFGLAEAQAEAARGFALAGFHQVTAGIGELFQNRGSVAVMRFEPSQRVVHVGQTVTWTNRDPETPHTVTFGDEPSSDIFQDFLPVGIDRPAHATIGSTGQSAHSGFIGAGLPFGTQFSATFTAPGTYAYKCALHDELGMKGTITVLP